MRTKVPQTSISVLTFLVLLLFGARTSTAAPGDLDPTFGTGGIVISPFTEFSDKPTSIQVQPDGKIIVSGYSFAYDEWCPCDYAVSGFIARYNSSGTLDASFGSNGKILIGNSNEYVGFKTALQPDGKIVAIGQRWTLNAAGNLVTAVDFAVFRYNANGTLDGSFGTGGKVFTSVGDGQFEPYYYEDPRDVVLQPDGKIVVMGFIFVNGSGYKFGIVRYNPDGSLDNNFGSGGKVITAMATNYGPNSDVNSMLLQPDGKIVLVGSYNYDILLVRYNADGSLDSGFGANGRVTHSTPSRDGGLDSVLQLDGKIVVAGYADSGSEIARYNANGSVDTSFANNGIFSTESGFFVGSGIALQPDGKIVGFGNASIGGSGNNSGFAVARLNPNGSPDASFGTNGRLITPIGTKGASFGLTVALQPNGKIIGSGVTDASNGLGDAAIVSYLGDVASPNPIDDPQFFVRQQYLDFLNREPDASGLSFWTNEITQCAGDTQCIEAKRVNVSAAFFLSIEFQETGYLVYRMYKAAYGDMSGTPVPLTRQEFLPDTQRLGQGVVVGAPGWEQQLENNKNTFAGEFVARSRFTTAFPQGMTAEQFVDALNTNAGGALSQGERDQLVSDLASGAKTRAQVLRSVAEDPDLAQAEFNRAFVLMQSFGYLRRNPNAAPDTNFDGYNFWLNKLNEFNGNFVAAEMVKAFISSGEYRQRFN